MEYMDVWEIIKEELSMVALLREIKKTGNKHDETQYPEFGAYVALKVIYMLIKGPKTALATHLGWLQMSLVVAQEVTGRIGTENERVEALFHTNGATDLSAANEAIWE